MKCTQCHFENPAEMQFCGKCGAKLEKRCPQCQFSNPPQFAFCGKCGHQFGDASPSSPKDSGFDTIQLSPEARKNRTFEALKQIVLKGNSVINY